MRDQAPTLTPTFSLSEGEGASRDQAPTLTPTLSLSEGEGASLHPSPPSREREQGEGEAPSD